MHPFGPLVLLGIAALAIVAAAGLTLLLARLTHPRPRGPFPPSQALPPPPDGQLAARLAPLLDAHPGLNAVQPLSDPIDALAVRLSLIEGAQSSVDLQYYVWQDDTVGALMLRALREAAGRGLRIRLLIDDNGTFGMDETLAALAGLPNLELRLFNPFPIRGARMLAYLADFRRLNHRMHNKAMVVDGTAAVLGGRNIGDDYFNSFAPGGLYMDMDVAVAGPVVADVARQFDMYWNAPAAVPAAVLLDALPQARAAALLSHRDRRLTLPPAETFQRALTEVPAPFDPHSNLHFAPATLVFDPPDKVQGLLQSHRMLWPHLRRALGQPRHELILISPYLVPTRSGVRALTRFAKAGVCVRLLTNSFAAGDVPLVHSGYAHRRRPLLRRGVEIWEYAPDAETLATATATAATATATAEDSLIDFIGARRRGTVPFARNKLHAKVFVVDRSRVFIGSFNFDPRSMRLNTELGLVIEAPDLAAAISDSFVTFVPARAWRVNLGRGGRLVWHRPGQPPQHHEPGAGLRTRVALAIAQRLPIEWML